MSGYVTDNLNFEISKGTIPNHSKLSVLGATDALTQNVDTDVWNFSDETTYTFSSTAIIDSISSDDNADTQDFFIDGLDSNWLRVIQTITLTGQTRKALDTSLLRVNQIINVDSSATLGNVYVYENTALTSGKPTDTTKVRAFSSINRQISHMGILSIAANKTAWFNGLRIGLSRKQATIAEFTGSFRVFGGIFLPRIEATLNTVGTSTIMIPTVGYLKIPPKTDIKGTVNADATGAGMSLNLNLIITDN